MKVVINIKYGGFGLSAAAMQSIAKRKQMHYIHYGKHSSGWLCSEPFDSWDDYVTRWPWVPMVGHGPEAPKLTNDRELARHDVDVVAVVEEMGEAANGSHAKLKIVDIPDGTDYEIAEYDGMEHIAERHRTWE